MADWASLPSDLLRRVGDDLLADHDIDCFMNLRAVCRHWRSATAKPGRDDLRFCPSQWVMLEEASKVDGDSTRLFINVSTGRLLRRRLPLLRDHTLMAVSTDGLLFFQKKYGYPASTRVLNPLTGSVLHFVSAMPTLTSRLIAAVAGSSDHLTLVLADHSDLRTYYDVGDDVCCAGPSTGLYGVDFSRPGPFLLASMLTYAGHIFIADLEGSIYKVVGEGRRCSGELIVEALPSVHVQDVFLVESVGELLLVRRLSNTMEVFKVDIEGKVLEPVKSIGRRALFLGERCLSVNADKLPSVDSNCIYSTWQLNFYRYDMKIGREENIPSAFVCDRKCLRVRPFSLVQVLLTYCVLIPYEPVHPMSCIQPGHRVFGIEWEGERDTASFMW